jgi:aryl-alcohol dehydrogenase-like predicted oxidoreductase
VCVSRPRPLLSRNSATPIGAILAQAVHPLLNQIIRAVRRGLFRGDERERMPCCSIQVEDTLHKSRVLDTVIEIADELGSTASAVSIAWVLARSRAITTSTVPIVGPRTVAHLEIYLRALEMEIPEEPLVRLDQVSAVPLGAPNDDKNRNLASDNGESELVAAVSPVA